MALKRIPIGALKLGMYVAGLDRSWVNTPFFRHRFLIKSESQVTRIRQSGAKEITIDTEKGLDVEADVAETVSLPGVEETAVAVDAIPIDEGGEPAGTDSASPAERSLSAQFSEARQARHEMLESVRSVFAWVRTEERMDRGKVLETAERLIGNVLKHHDAFLALIRTRDFHPELLDHVLNVATLSVILGQATGLTGAQLQRLAMGALLHDIGLLRVPANVLKKRAALTPPEHALYQRHPALGLAILEKTGGFDLEVLTIVHEHHALLDGGGFPPEVSAHVTQRASRIVMVANRYDELLSGQHDGEPMMPADALAALYRDAQRHRYDQDLVSLLISQIGVYPLFGLIELTSGERAVVVKVSKGKLLEPVVLLVTGPDRLPLPHPLMVDLSFQDDSAPCRKIARLLDAEREGVRIEEVLSKSDGLLQQAA
jgi:putative nucleotidyltransferase with HDIG domain